MSDDVEQMIQKGMADAAALHQHQQQGAVDGAMIEAFRAIATQLSRMAACQSLATIKAMLADEVQREGEHYSEERVQACEEVVGFLQTEIFNYEARCLNAKVEQQRKMQEAAKKVVEP